MRTWVIGVAAFLGLAGACGEDGASGPDAVADSAVLWGDVVTPDTAAVADTAGVPDTGAPPEDTGGPVDTALPADTETAADTAVAACSAGATACDGYLLMRCNTPAAGMVVDRVCPVGCTATEAGPAACASACVPGTAVGCVTSTARRCGADGASALTLSCLAGCDGAGRDCAALGSSEHEVFAANVAGVRVAGVGGDDVGRLAFAWQANVSGTPEPIRLLVTDADGNALSSPVALGGSDSVAFAQLIVRGAPDGAFAVLALEPTGATLWHVPVAANGVPTPASGPLVAGVVRKFPSLVVWSDAVALYDLAAAAVEGETLVRRTTWPLTGAAPVEEAVDAAALVRDDVVATRVGATEAHVYSARSGELRVTVSTPTVAGGATLAFPAGELLFAGAAGGGGASVVAAFDFAHDPEHGVYARFAAGTLGAFGDVGPGYWLQATATADGVAAALLAYDGALAWTAGDGAVVPAPAAWWTPAAAGAERTDFWVVLDPQRDRVRLVTLGRDAAGEPPRVRISAP